MIVEKNIICTILDMKMKYVKKYNKIYNDMIARVRYFHRQDSFRWNVMT